MLLVPAWAPSTPPAAPPVTAPTVPFELISTSRKPMTIPASTLLATCAAPLA